MPATVTRVPQLAASHLGLARDFGLRVPIPIPGYSFVCFHSLRQGRPDYTGPLVKVRNGTSNAEATVMPSDGLLRLESIVTVTVVGTSGYSIGQTMATSGASATTWRRAPPGSSHVSPTRVCSRRCAAYRRCGSTPPTTR
jgi:hypothetical protein